MTFIADIFPQSRITFFQRQWLLLRQDFYVWRLPFLFASLFSVLAIEIAHRLRLETSGEANSLSLNWSMGAVAPDNGGGAMLPVDAQIGVWGTCLALCLVFFLTGTFSDLARPQARQQWLLLPAPLWEKLLSRWLYSTILFPGLVVIISATWFQLRNEVPDAGTPAYKDMATALLCFGAAQALLFFLAGLLRTKTRTLPAFILSVVLINMVTESAGLTDAGLHVLAGGLLLLWPLTWLVFKRSKA